MPRPDGTLVMGFGAWLSTLPVLLKALVVLGIVVVGFGVGAAFVFSTLGAWRYLSEMLARRNKKKGGQDSGPETRL